MRRWLRVTLLSAAAVVAVVVATAVISLYVMLQPSRFTAMLQSQAAEAGLQLNLASPASPTLFPRPALELQGLTLSARGATMPILLAARGRLQLPWRALLGNETVISRLEIDSPRVDLDALQDWIAALPPRPEEAPPEIPRIDAGVHITRGSVVRGNQMLLSDVSLDAGSLISGQPFPLSLSAKGADGTPLQMRLSATPRVKGDALQLNDIALHFSQGAIMTLQLSGQARWHGAADASLSLAGTLDHADAGSYNTSFVLTPANDVDPLLLAVKLDGPENHADLRIPPIALADWWSQLDHPQGPRLSVPPGSGQAQIANLDIGGMNVEGLTIQTGVEPEPPAASEKATTTKAAGGKSTKKP
ncbi:MULTISPECIES: AsmA family protein [Dyella]|uniref:AsmA family protein n=2 Tax=Dyella TaxID=231454 RepID=A0A4R0YHB6_9GAMM|nr:MULTISPECIES: AsmA family protein [Dyella]TBR37161.1 AsmA family protein [Dyella terrae]TCI07749.1 AsmA family protein [Dyella soli]